MKKAIMLLALVIFVFGNTYSSGDPTRKKQNTSYTTWKADRLKELSTICDVLDSAINTPPPNDLTKSQLDEYSKQTKWLTDLRKSYSNHRAKYHTIKQGTTDAEQMAAMNMQFLALQDATQMESRKFQTLSNASKARHDIAMNSIRNMK